MIEIIGFIALVIWLGNKVSMTVAGLVLIAGIIGFLLLGRSIENDEWRARCNRRAYWRKNGPY